LRFFEERCQRQGIYIFDEPESALSPSRQMEFLKLMRRMENSGHCQVIMATHSPMLMAYPNARLLRLSKYGLEPVTVKETDHYKVMRSLRGSGGVCGGGSGGVGTPPLQLEASSPAADKLQFYLVACLDIAPETVMRHERIEINPDSWTANRSSAHARSGGACLAQAGCRNDAEAILVDHPRLTLDDIRARRHLPPITLADEDIVYG